jgi:hypothetical protein
VELHAPVEPGQLSRANRLLPEGIEITTCTMLPEHAPGLGKALAEFRLRILWPPGVPGGWPVSLASALDQDGEADFAALRAGLRNWQQTGDTLRLVVNAHPGRGPTPGVRELLSALGVPPAIATRLRVVREGWGTDERASGGEA